MSSARYIHRYSYPQIFMQTHLPRHRLFSREGSLQDTQHNKAFILHIRKQIQRSQSQAQRQPAQPQPTVSCCACCTKPHCLGILQHEELCYTDGGLHGFKTTAFVSHSPSSAPWMPLSQDPQLPSSLRFFLPAPGQVLHSLFHGRPSCWPICSLPRTLLFTFIFSKILRLRKVKFEHVRLQVGSHGCQRDKS